MRSNPIQIPEEEGEQEFFERVTDDEIMACWCFSRGTSISPCETWQAIVTGIALDMAFKKSKDWLQTEH